MKPNKLQQEVAALIGSEAAFWQHSNDITSPSHSCEIDSSIDNLELWDDMSAEQIHQLKHMMHDLYWFVRDLK